MNFVIKFAVGDNFYKEFWYFNLFAWRFIWVI